jgi:hypothetical protein
MDNKINLIYATTVLNLVIFLLTLLLVAWIKKTLIEVHKLVGEHSTKLTYLAQRLAVYEKTNALKK